MDLFDPSTQIVNWIAFYRELSMVYSADSFLQNPIQLATSITYVRNARRIVPERVAISPPFLVHHLCRFCTSLHTMGKA